MYMILRRYKYDFTEYDVKSGRFYDLRFREFAFFYNIDAWSRGHGNRLTKRNLAQTETKRKFDQTETKRNEILTRTQCYKEFRLLIQDIPS